MLIEYCIGGVCGNYNTKVSVSFHFYNNLYKQ